MRLLPAHPQLVSERTEVDLLASVRLPVCSRTFVRRLAAAALLSLCISSVAHAAAGGRSGAILGSRDRHGYLGVKFVTPSEDQLSALHLKGQHGAEVAMMDHDGPAGKAGLQIHDIVLQVDGKAVNSADELMKWLRESPPGRVVRFTVARLGQVMTLTARLATRDEVERSAWKQHTPVPEPEAAEELPDGFVVERYTIETTTSTGKPHGQSFIGSVLRTGPYTGASVDAMEPQLASFFGAPQRTGLLVHEVEPNSPAATAGLRAGDVVLRVDATTVASTAEWNRKLRAAIGRSVTLTILRDKREQTLSLQPDAKKHSEVVWPVLLPAGALPMLPPA